MPIRSKWAYWEELKDNQKENDLIVYQEGKANNTANGNSISWWLDPERDLNPEYLANMDMNTPIHWGNQSFNQYWDDSSPEMQATLGWKNEKYTGEATKNSDVNYNPDIKTWDLNPYYVYGQQSQVYGTLHPWYISQRNDNIASALYNEWRVSKEQVADYLAQQEWWYNSSEADRLNTIESIWKRLWQIAQQNKEEEPAPDMELNNDTSGKIYGKSTAETWEPTEWINTLSDANSVFKMMNESRVANYNALNSMQSSDIAASIDSWTIPSWTQAFRDLQEFNPTKYAEVMAEVKRLRWQDNVNAITNWEEIKTSADTTNINTQTTSDAINWSTASVSATQLLKSIDSILESNDTAKSAEELMWSIENDMAKLKERLKNLKNEANTVFKWDVPDYLVKAYINNRTQEIQSQLSILEDRYNAAYNRYKTELAHSEREAEYSLKKDSASLNSYKEDNKNSGSSSSTNKNYMRTERNNNPTAMTTDMAKMLWWELGVDYEIWDSFVWGDWKTYYTAKLIWDPIETTIRLIDRWIENGIDPFYRANWQPRWSYMDKIWVNKDKWKRFTREQKEIAIKRMLEHEWWSMDNMAYYLEQNASDWNWWTSWTEWYDETYSKIYEKYLSWDYSKARLETQTKAMWISEQELDNQAKAWKAAEDKKIEENKKNKPKTFTRKDWKEFDMSNTPTYDSLTYDQQNIVQQLVNLNKDPKILNKRQYWDDFEKILSAAKEINPDWSEDDFWQQDKVTKEWNTSTKVWSNSRNWTAVATAKDIYYLADEIWNDRWRDWNSMLNIFKEHMSDEAYTKLLLNMDILATEYAWALKGNNAAPTTEEINAKKELLAANLWAWAMKTAAKEIAKTLFNKNANEAMNYKEVTLKKPPLIVVQDVADWMYDVVWIKEMVDLYDYTPSPYLEQPRDLDVSQYKWKSIMDAINWSTVSQPKSHSDLKNFTTDRLKNRQS